MNPVDERRQWVQETVEAICEKVGCHVPEIVWAPLVHRDRKKEVGFRSQYTFLSSLGGSPSGRLHVDPAALDLSDIQLRYRLTAELALNGTRDRVIRVWAAVGLPLLCATILILVTKLELQSNTGLYPVVFIGAIVWTAIAAGLQGPSLQMRVLELTGEIQPIVDEMTAQASLGKATTLERRRKLERKLKADVEKLKRQAIARGYIAKTDEGTVDLPPSPFGAIDA